MGQWIASGDNQKYSERCVNSDNHEEIVGRTDVPPPAGWPENRQWIDSCDENEADGHQGYAQILEAKSIDHNVWSRVIAGRLMSRPTMVSVVESIRGLPRRMSGASFASSSQASAMTAIDTFMFGMRTG